jgi:1-acyl-sn-glycerol-3-phosphate acyltransferase
MDEFNQNKFWGSKFTISHSAPDCGIIKCVISRTIMWIVGWKVTGKLPEHKKFILVGEPHTSNWDFLLMFGAAYSLRLKISWLGKDSIFKRPFGTIMRYFGGIPIDRKRKHNLVERTSKLFQDSKSLVIVVGPSGTRSKRKYWKSGFYWIAHTANIHVVCGYLDFTNKIVHVGLCFLPTGDVKKDMNKIRKFYRGIKAKHPELETDMRLKDE